MIKDKETDLLFYLSDEHGMYIQQSRQQYTMEHVHIEMLRKRLKVDEK